MFRSSWKRDTLRPCSANRSVEASLARQRSIPRNFFDPFVTRRCNSSETRREVRSHRAKRSCIMFLENTASLRAKHDVAKTRAGLTDTADLCSTHPLISGTDSLQGRMVEPSSTARAVNAPSMPVNAGRLKQLLAQTQLVASVQDPYRSVDSAQWHGQTCANSLPSHLAEVVGSRRTHAVSLLQASASADPSGSESWFAPRSFQASLIVPTIPSYRMRRSQRRLAGRSRKNSFWEGALFCSH